MLFQIFLHIIIVFLPMRVSTNSKQNEVISLRNWPLYRAKSSEIKLSPETSKIIQSSGILVEQIAPKTLEDFIYDNKLQKKSSQEVIKMYRQFTQRQNKKIALLKLVKENNLNIQKKQSQSQLIQCEYLGVSKNSTKDSHKLTPFKKKKSKNSIISSLSKSKGKNTMKTSKKQQKIRQSSSRLDYYGNSSGSFQNQKNISNKYNLISNNGNSKSEIKIIKKFSLPHDDYNDIDSVKPPMSDIRSKDEGNGQFYKQMTNYANKVMQMSTKQNKQLRDSKDLNEKQKNRLRKIHQVQKQRLHQQMNRIVKSLSPSKIVRNY